MSLWNKSISKKKSAVDQADVRPFDIRLGEALKDSNWDILFDECQEVLASKKKPPVKVYLYASNALQNRGLFSEAADLLEKAVNKRPDVASLQRKLKDLKRRLKFNAVGNELSQKARTSEQLVKFLAFGFDLNKSSFQEHLNNLTESFTFSNTGNPTALPKTPLSLEKALEQAIVEEVSKSTSNVASIGITGGMDSRLLYAALKEFLPNYKLKTFTIGYPGQYDFEFVKNYLIKILDGHTFVDTRELKWDLQKEISHRKKLRQPGCYNSKEKAYRELYKLGFPTENIHGFMGDPLAGGTKPSSHIKVDGWADALNRFTKKNNRFCLQSLFSENELKAFLPDSCREIKGFDFYDMLDFGLRQKQRILVDSTDTITPYANSIWLSAMSNIPQRDRERVYFDFVRERFKDYFPELEKFRIKSRVEHMNFRKQFLEQVDERLIKSGEKNPDGSMFVPQIRSDFGRPLPGRQFCEYSEYNNNESFKQFFNETYELTRRRALLNENYLEYVFDGFLAGQKSDTERLRGILNLEINIQAGKIQIN